MQVQNKQSITVDLRRSMTMPVPRYRQHDTNILEIKVLDNAQPADLSNVTWITAAYKRPDKEVVSRIVSKEGNVLTYQIGKEECDYPGKGELMIQFYEGDQRLSTMKIQVIIDSSFEPDIEGTEDLQLLQELFIEVDTRLADINRTNEIYQVNEAKRKENEVTRQDQEAARLAAENRREAAETTRQEQESARQTNTAQAISDAVAATQHAATQGDYAKEQGDYAKTQGDAAAQRLAELNNADAAQLDDRLTEVEGRLSETGRHTQILEPGMNILDANVATPVDFEIQGRTLINLLGKKGGFETASTSGDTGEYWTAIGTGNPLYAYFSIENGRQVIESRENTTFSGRVQILNLLYEPGKYYVAVTEVETVGIGAWTGVRSNGSGGLGATSNTARIPADFKGVSVNKIAGTGGDGWIQLSADRDAGQTKIGKVYFDNVRIYEITRAEYEKIGLEWTDEEVARRYPYVEHAQHLQNPYVIAQGENLMPPFHTWSIPTADMPALSQSPYEYVTEVKTHTKYMESPVIDVVKGREYTFSLNKDKTVQFAIRDAVTNEYLYGYTTNNSRTFTATSDKIIIYMRTGSSVDPIDNPYTFSRPMLTPGNTVKPFTPSNPSFLYAETKLASVGNRKDVLYKEEGRWKVRHTIEKEFILDGSLDWRLSSVVSTDLSFKRFIIGILLPGMSQMSDQMIAYDYMYNVYKGITLNASNATPKPFQVGSGNVNPFITVPNSLTGFGESYAPTNDEIKAYFNGWKVKTSDETGKPIAWISVVDSTDAPTQTLEYVSTNRASNYTPYKLSYALSFPVTEEVDVEGDIVADGLTQMEVGSGVIVREKLTPQLVNGNLYYMNHIPYKNTLENKPDRFIAVYKGREIDNSWITNRHANYYGGIGLQSSNVDPEADYYVTYIVQEKHRFTTNPVDVKAMFAKNIRSAYDDLAVKVSDIATGQTALNTLTAELLRRIKALEGA